MNIIDILTNQRYNAHINNKENKLMKFYTQRQIQIEFDNLEQTQQISTLYEAIDNMQQYNGRTTFACISIAMGYSNHEGEYSTYVKVNQ